MAESRSALVVDDERDIRELLVMTLGRMGLRCDTAASVGDARAQLARQRYDLCLTDMRLPDGSGLEVIAEINQKYPNTPVAMITAFGNVEAAVEALKAGAFDFVAKPVDLAVLRDLVRHALELHDKQRAPADAVASRLYGESPPIVSLRHTIAKVARSQAPVYIAGESGVGKELVARTIHAEGGRAAGPFVPVNCGAIPSELMESEFFGHKKGSFTGAHADKPGLFQTADGGTLFLDEVAELPLPMQVKLLRAIQEKSIRPVGANTEVVVDVRILSATHKNLAALVEDGRFRHDLYYRINVIELRVPPLRERLEDLPGLCREHPGPPGRRPGPPGAAPVRRRHRGPRRLPVPRQRARTGEHPRARPGHGRWRLHRRRRPAPAQGHAPPPRPAGAGAPAPRPPRSPRPPASTRARSTRATPPPARCPRTSRKSSAPRSSTRCRKTATTRPAPPPRWASPSGRCATS